MASASCLERAISRSTNWRCSADIVPIAPVRISVVEEAGTEHGDPDTVGRGLGRERLAERDHGRLRGVVGPHLGAEPKAAAEATFSTCPRRRARMPGTK